MTCSFCDLQLDYKEIQVHIQCGEGRATLNVCTGCIEIIKRSESNPGWSGKEHQPFCHCCQQSNDDDKKGVIFPPHRYSPDEINIRYMCRACLASLIKTIDKDEEMDDKKINHTCRKITIDINQAVNYWDKSDLDGYIFNLERAIKSLEELIQEVRG